MPEYSSTTITPADGVKTPAMNGSTSGNYTLSALRDFILASKGQANGLASLDANGKLPSSQLPDLADDVIVVASYATLPATGTAGKLYITADNNKMYRWDPDLATPDYVELSVDLSAYATKAELAEEESARTAADSNLLGAIQANSNRISNLEQEHGGYVTVNYRGTDAVPTGKAKYGLVESIVGKSRAWNQQTNHASFVNGTLHNVEFTYMGNGIIKANGTASNVVYKAVPMSFTIGHYYLFVLSGFVQGSVYLSDQSGNGVIPLGTYQSIIRQVNATADIRITIENGTALTNKELFIETRDLSLIFPEGVPVDVAGCVAKCPVILKYDAYGYSLVDTVVEGVESTSKNLFDIEWLLLMSGWSHTGGYYTGQVNANKSALLEKMNGMDIKGKRIALTLEGYTSSANRGMAWVINYTDNSTEELRLEGTTQGTWTLVSNQNKTVDHFSLSYGSGTTIDYYSAIQIEIGSVATEVVPYGTLDTLTLPQSVTLRSAGSVEDTDELNVEVNGVARRRQTTRVGTDTVSINSIYERSTNPNCNFALFQMQTWMQNWSNTMVAGCSVSSDGWDSVSKEGELLIYDTGSRLIAISIGKSVTLATAQATYNGRAIRFDLTTESVTLLEPISNNTIQTEGGGTINTIQTQSPVIDNSMDVGYLAL